MKAQLKDGQGNTLAEINNVFSDQQMFVFDIDRAGVFTDLLIDGETPDWFKRWRWHSNGKVNHQPFRVNVGQQVTFRVP